ncbi:hypothetical protein [Halosolutus gelatinilyticus]|uniref:hypothetical protein n=1 Tax=Halosolutus gelatinilyticus TaxID=2931975 RepID=UPI001FF138B6|nr:hypothetical protein [Halosolutus gelatinilyticus]
MGLTRSIVTEKAADYRAEEPLYPVEQEQIETLPKAFAAGEFGWRDAEWVVQWHYRRFLGAVPNDERREREKRFGRNDFTDVRDAIVAVAGAPDPADRLDRLTALEGVDVPVGSAFLQFSDPEACLAVGEREWSALCEHGELADPYPDPPSIAAYESYLDACRSACGRLDCDAWTLYRALWRLWKD